MSTESTAPMVAPAIGVPIRARGRLQRILHVGFGLAAAVGNTGGVYAILCRGAVAELGATLPQAGGWYVLKHSLFTLIPAARAFPAYQVIPKQRVPSSIA